MADGLQNSGRSAPGAFATAGDGVQLGVVAGLSFERYQAVPAVSKSRLWTAITRSPAHAWVEDEPSNAMQMGTAVHCAVLEPDLFAERFVRGPDDRRGLKWKEALDEHGDALLTSGDYDDALRIRDALHRDATIGRLLRGDLEREVSGFWIDPDTGLLCRCRPDAYRADGLVIDLKMTADVRPEVFARRVADLGYHAQEALYTDGWRACGRDVAAFVFLAVEQKPPFAFRLYELTPDAVEVGRSKMRAALALWAKCRADEHWPAYDPAVTTLDLPRWAAAAAD